MDIFLAIAGFSLMAWIYLVAGRGGFWITSRYNDLAPPSQRADWPAIVVVTPARDEALGVGNCVRSVLGQPYPGEFSMVLVDDQSSDGTAQIARDAAASIGASHRLTVLPGRALPSGWTGKLWAVKQGLAHVENSAVRPKYVLLTDADIVYSGEVLMRLVERAEQGQLVMTSVMARLRTESLAEKFLVPAFVFFFQLLYPFAWVRDPYRATAAAAGGCLLARWDALSDAGGIDAIRGSLIDDCALGARLKTQGRVWLGFSQDVRSVRGSETVRDVGRMISRSAYAQLLYSPVILAGTIAGMAVVYLTPPALALFGQGIARDFGLFSCLLMVLAFLPTLRYYRQSVLWALILPVIATAYMVFTVISAFQFYRGRGGMWKGRAQAQASSPR